ncbi:CRISPR-associated protein Cas1 [Pasteurellaceae bacterium NI1060]|nr:CRISPR-associated protein Cas1 [Pasteurellaceae bacterium NI1060]
MSYDIIMPSAARGILAAVHWKPAILWVIDRIYVLKPIRFESVRRNELGSKISESKVSGAMRRHVISGCSAICCAKTVVLFSMDATADQVNALLSFVYSILGKDISGALQGVGLDPQVGFLHADRPGRDSLAQDILEEFRAWWADRLVLSLINRGQIKSKDFVTEAGGAVNIKPEARKLLFQTLQAKKQEKIVHPFLQEEVVVGLLPHIQAMLLARHLRGDLAEYPPFLMR